MSDTAHVHILDEYDTDTAVRQYLGTALWSSNDDDADPEGYGHPLDEDHDTDDVAPETAAQARADVLAFVLLAGPDDVRAYLDAFGGDAGQLGHDLWLTRNGHGAGFWDRFPHGSELAAVGDRLTAHAHTLGEIHLYVGDDGLIYGE